MLISCRQKHIFCTDTQFMEVEMKREELATMNKVFREQLLGRLESDCKYYLGLGNRNADNLWAKEEQDQIQVMKMLYESFADDEKPDWITMADIERYEEEMLREAEAEMPEPFECIPGICAIYSYDDGKEKAAVYRTANDTYINYYGWMGESLSDADAKWHSSAGPFDSYAKAEELILRHRPNTVKIASK